VFTRIVEGEYDTSTGAAATTTVVTTAKAVLDNYTGSQMQFGVELGDKRLWVAGLDLDIAPQPGDKVTADGADWVVVRSDKINPDGNVYLYDVQVRR
jgi:hypothetical protein